MLHRRSLLAAVPATALSAGAEGGFGAFLRGVRAEAKGAGISAATLDAALSGIRPNPKVIEADRRQPEFTMTWDRYRQLTMSDARVQRGRGAFADNARLLAAVEARYGVDRRAIAGIWGLESNFGTNTGTYNVVEALATLAWEGRRAAFFRAHLLSSLRILDHGDVAPARMLGSYAGAMGQPQFMPDSYLRYAVDFDNDGRRDIWDSVPDVLGSVGNYLARSGWRAGEPWGQPVRVPPGFDAAGAGRDVRRTLAEWSRMGVTRPDGGAFSRGDVSGAVVLPDGAGGPAFMTYANFNAIRRYNPSDFYALAVGTLGDLLA